VRAGFHADLVAFDPDTVGGGPAVRVHGQPGGSDRLIARSTGVEYTWVNGVATRAVGHDVPDVAPGRLPRS
jgi:N-acyl-D-amino-acid deacylase